MDRKPSLFSASFPSTKSLKDDTQNDRSDSSVENPQSWRLKHLHGDPSITDSTNERAHRDVTASRKAPFAGFPIIAEYRDKSAASKCTDAHQD